MCWSSCYTKHKLSVLRLRNRLVSLSSARGTKQILQWDLSYSLRPGSWTYVVEKLFTNTDMAFLFEYQIPCDLETAYHFPRSLYQDVCDAERYLKPKLRYYNLFKPDLSQTEYLSLNIPKYQRSLFAQFRAGVLPLQVEIGRFRETLLEERFCNLCDMDQVEDGFPFLCIRTDYSDFREVLYIKATHVFPAFSELNDLKKNVSLLNNLQRHVIIYLNDAVYRSRSSLFDSWKCSNDSHAYVLYCFLNLSVTYKLVQWGWVILFNFVRVYDVYVYHMSR